MKTLWPHQRDGAGWLGQRQYGYLYWEVGAGKTMTTLEALRASGMVLVVCPIPVGTSWQRETARVDPGREVILAVEGTAAKRAKLIAGAAGRRAMVVINYESIYRGPVAKALAATQWDAIVCDEAHKIKSPKGKASRWLAKLAEKQPAAKRICLSGTPCPNDPRDWFAQWRFLDPTLLGTNFTGFVERIAWRHPQYRSMITGWKDEGLAALRARIDPHTHRVSTDDVLSLPDAVHANLPVTLSKDEQAFYDAMEKEMVAAIGDQQIVADNPLVRSIKLRQATSGYVKTDEGVARFSEQSSKGQVLAEWLSNLPSKEPVVVFCLGHDEMDQCHRICRDGGRESLELSGRRRQHDEWSAGKGNVLIVQQQAGGAGVSLVRACYCVYWTLSWSLGDLEQSLGRLRRPGQTRTTHFFHLVATGTIDESIYGAIEEKREIVGAITESLTRRTGK